MNYQHFIITFFNLKIWIKDKAKQQTDTDEWLEDRFRLFETYCLPSVKAQTCQEFVWLCLFDECTSLHFRNRIAEYKKSVPQLHDCYFTEEQAGQYYDADEHTRCRFIRDEVRKLLDASTEYVITTNLDNDDAINNHMVEWMKKEIEGNNSTPMVYRFIKGIQYFSAPNIALRMNYPHNHFLSLVENAKGDFHTVVFYQHARAHRILPYTDINKKAAWMEVVHHRNVINDLRVTSRISYLPFLRSCILDEFGFPITLSLGNNIRKILFWLPPYLCKIIVWRLTKKVKKKIQKNRDDLYEVQRQHMMATSQEQLKKGGI